MQRGEAVLAISDGSYKDNLGTAAWLIRAEGRPLTTVSGRCHIPGRPTDHSAYRSELGGLYGALCFLHAIEEFYSLSMPKVHLGCDGDSPMAQAFVTSERLSPEMNHYDLIGACRKLMTMLSSRPLITYVKGHAEKDKDEDDPTEAEFLNKLCDAGAKEYLGYAAVPLRELAGDSYEPLWSVTQPWQADYYVIRVFFSPDYY